MYKTMKLDKLRCQIITYHIGRTRATTDEAGEIIDVFYFFFLTLFTSISTAAKSAEL